MKVIKSNNIITFDVDNTIIMWSGDYRRLDTERVQLSYGGKHVYLVPNETHIDFMRHCKERGDFIILWSQNGYSWAEQVAFKLGLEKYIDVVMSKPVRHVDDKKEAHDIVGNRIYISEK